MRAKQGVDQHTQLVEKNDSLMQELSAVRKQLDTIKAVAEDSSTSHVDKIIAERVSSEDKSAVTER